MSKRNLYPGNVVGISLIAAGLFFGLIALGEPTIHPSPPSASIPLSVICLLGGIAFKLFADPDWPYK